MKELRTQLKRNDLRTEDEERRQPRRKTTMFWRWQGGPQFQFLFFCMDPGSASRYRSPTSIPRMERLATIRGASTPTVGAAVPNTNNSERKCPKARKKVHSVMW